MDSMGSSFKLCFSRGTAIAQDFRPRELACFVIFAYFCYRNLDTYNYWYILILLLETQGHETSPTFSKNWIFVLFCLCGVGLSACQSNSLADISGAGRIGSAPVRCRHPGSQRCLPKVDLPFRVCGPDPRRARKGRGIQCNAERFLWRKSGDVSMDMAQPSRAVWKIWEMRIILW